MPRKVSIAVCVLASAALFAMTAPAAQAANTWEGVWDSDFGRLTMSASGAGSYEGFSPGTISGPAVGDVNEGTWKQSNSSGTYRFVLSGGGQSFTGTWEYDPPGSGCGTACGWNGTCIEGACLNNSAGGGGGTACRPLPGATGLLAAARADSCPGQVKFSVRTHDGFPAKPDDKDLPRTLLAIQARGGGLLAPGAPGQGYAGVGGIIHLFTTHTFAFDERVITLQVKGPATYVKNGNQRRVDFGGHVEHSSDKFCDDGGNHETVPFRGALAVKGERANLRLNLNGCLSEKPLLWKTREIEKASIKVVK